MKTSIKILLACFLLCVFVGCVSAQCVERSADRWKRFRKIDEKPPAERIVLWGKEIEKVPSCFALYVERGKVYASEGNYDLAFADFRKAKELLPLTTSREWEAEVNGFRYNSGSNYREEFLPEIKRIAEKTRSENNFKACAEAYDIALLLYAQYASEPYGYSARGDCHYGDGQFAAAAADYLKAFPRYRNSERALEFLSVILRLSDLPQKEKFYLESCRLKSDKGSFDEAIADCEQALKIDPKLSEATAILQKLKSKKADAAEKASDPRGYLRRTDPIRFEILRQAIEEKNPKTIENMLRQTPYFDCRFCGDFFNGTKEVVLYQRIGRPELRFKLLSQSNPLPVMAITRDVEIWLAGKYRSESDGARIDGTPKEQMRGQYGGLFSYSMSGDKLILTSVISEGGVETFGRSLERQSGNVSTLSQNCNCNPLGGILSQSFQMTEELKNIASLEVSRINWNGEISIRAITGKGDEWRFSGQFTRSFVEPEKVPPPKLLPSEPQPAVKTPDTISPPSVSPPRVAAPAVQAGHFGQAVIVRAGVHYPTCISDNCLDLSWMTPEQKKRVETSGWHGYNPKNGDKGEIIFEGVSRNGYKVVVLKIGENYVPILASGINRL